MSIKSMVSRIAFQSILSLGTVTLYEAHTVGFMLMTSTSCLLLETLKTVETQHESAIEDGFRVFQGL
jgi:hypothetical protein